MFFIWFAIYDLNIFKCEMMDTVQSIIVINTSIRVELKFDDGHYSCGFQVDLLNSPQHSKLCSCYPGSLVCPPCSVHKPGK